MKVMKVLSVLVVLAGVGAVAWAVTPPTFGQERRGREFTMLAGRGPEIGVSVRDVESSDKAAGGGVVVEEVRADSPAEKAGLKRSDIVVEFDGERVRSARQFTRLVRETTPDRSVQASIVRDGQKKDVQITPTEGRDTMLIEGGRLREHLGDLERYAEHLPPFDFKFDLALPGLLDSHRRLGVAVEELTPQLASYFGAKDGVLVASVGEDSPAARAGLKAGDVITKVNSEPVRSRGDLVRSLHDARDGEVTLVIVREKKESTVTVKLETRRSRGGRPA